VKRIANIVSLLILCIATCSAQDNPMHHVFTIARFQATVAGKVCDTISREELLNAGTVDLNGYENYKIVSFVCNVTSISPYAKDTTNKSIVRLESNSGKFTTNMYRAFQGLYGVVHICFTDIFCRGPNRKITKLNDVQLALQDNTNYAIDTTGSALAWRSRGARGIGYYYFEVGVAGNSGGLIRKKQLLDAGKLQLFNYWNNKTYVYKAAHILSYKACIRTRKGYRARYSDDANFTPAMLYFMENAKPGSRVIFRKIEVLLPDGRVETIRRRVFKLKKHWFFNRDV
jgi:hypothetical protein